MTAVNKETVGILAAAGVSTGDMSALFGRTPGRISQAIAAARAEQAEVDRNTLGFLDQAVDTTTGELLLARPESIEDKITSLQNKLELRALEALADKLDLALNVKPRELVHIAKVINSMQRRTGGVTGHGDISGNVNITDNRIVALNIPLPQRPTIVKNEQGQVIESNGRTLVTASKVQVLEDLRDSKNQERITQYADSERINASSKRFEIDVSKD